MVESWTFEIFEPHRYVHLGEGLYVKTAKDLGAPPHEYTRASRGLL